MHWRTLLIALTLSGSALAQERWAAIAPNHEYSSNVVWATSQDQANRRAIAACKRVSNSCASRPASTNGMNNYFAIMCCTKPQTGCAAGVAGSKVGALFKVKSTFLDAGFSSCSVKSYIKAGTGEKKYGAPRTVDRGYVLPRPEQVARAQAYLLALGYDAGPIDGSYGLRTKAAIESFQRDYNLRVDGAVTAKLIAALTLRGRNGRPYNPYKGGIEPSRAEGDGIDLPPWRELAGFAPSAQLTEKLDPSDIFERVEGAIWKVVTLKGGTEHQGSAVAVTKDNLITNCHIFAGGGRVSIIRQERKVPVKLIAGDKESDRCVVQASQPLDTYVREVRPFAGLKIGERVYAVGSPRGLDLTLSEGIISGLRTGSKSRYIQTTAPISPGSSGGGLFDEGGNLIGITTFLIKKSQSLNFALAADEYWK